MARYDWFISLHVCTYGTYIYHRKTKKSLYTGNPVTQCIPPISFLSSFVIELKIGTFSFIFSYRLMYKNQMRDESVSAKVGNIFFHWTHETEKRKKAQTTWKVPGGKRGSQDGMVAKRLPLSSEVRGSIPVGSLSDRFFLACQFFLPSKPILTY